MYRGRRVLAASQATNIAQNMVPNEYEAERARIIARNEERLKQLGLKQAADALEALCHRSRTTYKKRARPQEQGPPTASRSSRRLKGMEVECSKDDLPEETEEETGAGPGSKKTFSLIITDAVYEAPFTIRSIRFKAQKVVWDILWEMDIQEGPAGPVFKVTNTHSGKVYQGPSPTQPWTDACLKHRPTQRISGPLFYGFSDAHVQRAIAAMYTPEEMREFLAQNKGITVSRAAAARVSEAAAAEGPHLPPALSIAELAAAEFRSIKGIGEAVSVALATTSALGGTPHASLAALRSWVQASSHNAAALEDFLLSSAEMPVACRNWPAWRNKFVPDIVVELRGKRYHCDDEQQQGQ